MPSIKNYVQKTLSLSCLAISFSIYIQPPAQTTHWPELFLNHFNRLGMNNNAINTKIQSNDETDTVMNNLCKLYINLMKDKSKKQICITSAISLNLDYILILL